MIRGEPAIAREDRAATLYSVAPCGSRTMKQSFASAARLRGGGPILVWGFRCQALFVGFIFILSFSSFFVRLRSCFFALACIRRVRRAAAVDTGQRPPPEAARSGVDDREHGATLDQVGLATVMLGS